MKFYQFQSNIKLFQKVSSVIQQFKTLKLVNEVRNLYLFRKKNITILKKIFKLIFGFAQNLIGKKQYFAVFVQKNKCQKKSIDSMRQTKEQSLLCKKPEVSKWSRSLFGFFAKFQAFRPGSSFWRGYGNEKMSHHFLIGRHLQIQNSSKR